MAYGCMAVSWGAVASQPVAPECRGDDWNPLVLSPLRTKCCDGRWNLLATNQPASTTSVATTTRNRPRELKKRGGIRLLGALSAVGAGRLVDSEG